MNPEPTNLNQTQSIQSNHIENLKVISVNKFIFLSLISFGLYPIWWMFKAWRFFLIKDKLNIMPAARAIFSIFFLYSLFNRIKTYAKEQGYINDFSSGWMYSQTTLLFIQDSKKTRNNSSTESINHSLRLRLTHAHICSIGFKSGLYAGSQRILCPCCSNNS